MIALDDVMIRPGLAKAPLAAAEADTKKRKATG
jgi:hypothetical protein